MDYFAKCCLICRDDEVDADFTTRCGHNFHESCLEDWLDIRKECPLCRAEFLKFDRIRIKIFRGLNISSLNWNLSRLKILLHEVCTERYNPEMLDRLYKLHVNGYPHNDANLSPKFVEIEQLHLNILKIFLENRVKIDFLSPDGDNLTLKFACDNNHLEVLKLLFSRGANINTIFRDGTTALYLTCRNGYLELANYLIDKGANINFRYKSESESEESLVQVAAIHGHLDIVSLLYRNYISIRRDEMSGILDKICTSGHFHIIKFLLEKYTKIISKDDLKLIPFCKICEKGSPEDIKFMLEQGCEINSRDQNGFTAIHYACNVDDANMLNFLIELGADYDVEFLMFSACSCGKLNVIKFLLDRGADVNMKNEHGSLINHACPTYDAPDNAEVITLLLDSGLSINLSESYIMHTACSKGRLNTVTLLLNVGIDINIQDDNGFLPIHHASMANNPAIINLLLDHGADINSKDNEGRTALFIACSDNERSCLSMEMITLLIKRGADTRIQNNNGSTLLHRACELNNYTLIEHLINLDAFHYDCLDRKGKTPIQVARKKGNYMTAEAIKRA